ncbi:MAG: small protein [Chloroflexi bacterium UTCFX4]|jgi:predicted HTH domain antitoxin|nr:MAG: small protein [Chloroflexi bacterium UTCFX4]
MTITIDYPEELATSLHLSTREFESEFRMAAAAKLFELGRISSGRAAELAGIPRVLFLKRVGDYGVPVFDLTPEELEQDFINASR